LASATCSVQKFLTKTPRTSKLESIKEPFLQKPNQTFENNIQKSDGINTSSEKESEREKEEKILSYYKKLDDIKLIDETCSEE
jgi:hypothetical protein